MTNTHSPIVGSDRKPLPGAVATSRTNPNTTIEVTLKLRRKAALPPVTKRPTKILTRDQLRDTYGANQSDIDTVVKTLGTFGLTLVRARNGLTHMCIFLQTDLKARRNEKGPELAGPPSSCFESAPQIMTQESLAAQPREVSITRGQTWLLIRPFSAQSKKRGLFRNSKKEALSDIALDAVIENLVCLTHSSQTIQRYPECLPPLHFTQAHHRIPQLEFSVHIAERFTITYSDFWFHSRSSILPDDELKIASDSIMREVAEKSALHVPEGQEWIMVEENKCYRVMSEWQDRIKKKSAWHTPLGAVISLASLLAVSEFKDLSWIQKGTLKGFFLFCFVGCIAWLVREIWRAAKSGSSSIEVLIADLKKGTTRHDLSDTPTSLALSPPRA